jgi:peptide/nickel transport system ATP-binding protein
MASAEKRTVLRVKDLQVLLPTGRGLLRAVDRVSFCLRAGETLGIVGESGCGKSMLARAITRLLPHDAVVPADARVEFDGHELVGMPEREVRRIVGREIAVIFQDPMTSLNPVMKVGRQVSEVVRLHLKLSRGQAHERAVALLDLVGVPMAAQRADQFPHQLSGGMRQRVAIAIALACEPKLLIADEPTTALDATVQAAILDLLARLQRERRMAMMLITHDLSVAAARAERAAVMYAGKIVEQASANELFKQMRMPYTQALMAAVPRLTNRPHTRLKAIDGQPPDMVGPTSGCRFAPRCWKRKPLCTKSEPPLKAIDGSEHELACWFPLEGSASP